MGFYSMHKTVEECCDLLREAIGEYSDDNHRDVVKDRVWVFWPVSTSAFFKVILYMVHCIITRWVFCFHKDSILEVLHEHRETASYV